LIYIYALFLFIAGMLLVLIAERQRKKTGVPRGRIIYSDTGSWGPVEQPLYDRNLALTGKPDYLVESGDDLIPVEVKSSRAPAVPYDSHIFQLAAYCLLVESHFGHRPPYGILKYADRTFAVDFSEKLEESLLDLLDEMRLDERKREVNRSHEQASRCMRCGYRSACDEKL
jgi:CRISPR-associated exonuclease Cas4